MRLKVVLLLLGGALLWATRRLPMRLVTGEQMVRCAAAAALVALGLFAYFIWPRIAHVTLVPYWYGGGFLSVQNHLSLVHVAWYLSPLGVWLGIAGMALMLLRGDIGRMWGPVLTGLAFSTAYLYNIMNNPLHIFVMRRYVPVVFPFFAAGMAYALVWLWDQRRRCRAAGAVAWLSWIGCYTTAVRCGTWWSIAACWTRWSCWRRNSNPRRFSYLKTTCRSVPVASSAHRCSMCMALQPLTCRRNG